ncbi:protein involved in gliding motility EpsA [Algoriphagus boseongensis]|uniref:Protein involved in gliding motility EpsA n=1 Tax=Algoriphagus boseongensis TaxID=1442587 RepID=A0A4R6T9G9_9BACT|nr:polysaccharide biosynthesis/export family protein [Algoriphagus boseongensis]TDQ19401.1 protein involved in gliding motility EpsA [Algoriphagus boseongensis]
MLKYLKAIGIVGLAWATFSCVSNEKIIYLQNLEGNQPISEGELISYEIPEYRLQYNDILDVNIQTIEDMIKNGFSFQNRQGGVMAQGGSGGDVYYLTGYKIDKYGNIRLPIVGEVNVKEKTIDEARLEIEKKLREYVTSEFYLSVKLGGIRYSALGEFRQPGQFVVLQERLTIFEAVANAGDLSTIAKRNEILLIRQYPEGTKLHRVNLNDRQLIQSPFYFIQPNDQLYAEPMKIREIGAGESGIQNFLLLSSVLTTVFLIANLFVN